MPRIASLKGTLASFCLVSLVACGGLDNEGPARRGSGIASTATSDQTGTKPTTPTPPGTQGPGTSIPDDTSSDLADAGTVPADSGTTDPGTTDPGTTDPTPPASTKKVLDIVWKGQETYWWCGPGSTRIALSARIAADDLPTQTQIASALPTTEEGTSHIGLVVNYLNGKFALSGPTAYVSRPIGDPATPTETDRLKKDLVSRIDAGFPLVANVVSGWRPPTYPGGTIYHYVAVVGYDESGDKAMIADPAAEGNGGGSQWNDVPRTYWIATSDLAVWIGGKGYTG